MKLDEYQERATKYDLFEKTELREIGFLEKVLGASW